MLVCDVYRSPRKQEMYLYVDRTRGLEDVPATLMSGFGEPELVMTIPLTAERNLARADTGEVLANIRDSGFYLQMPPTMAELLARDGHGE
jgi:uncharacterized protein YcgL (UPF0745 family)